MSLTSVAALIAAVSFAVLAGAGAYLAVRFTRVLGDAATLVRETSAGQQALLARANATVDRANAQLDRHEAVTASMDELGESVAELAGQASALAGIGKTVAGVLIGGPAGKAAAVAYGVRHAVALRRGTATRRRALPGEVVTGAELPASAGAASASAASASAATSGGSPGTSGAAGNPGAGRGGGTGRRRTGAAR